MQVSQDQKLHFSGHETFALRYGWLKKVVDALEAESGASRTIFSANDAMAHFGVGKNMVSSMRHWAVATNVVQFNKEHGHYLTDFGRILFADGAGMDPYVENPDTLWLLHWQLTTQLSQCTTWHFAFHQFSKNLFDRDALVSELKAFCLFRGQDNVATKSIRRDVDCFLNTYVMKRGKGTRLGEDTLECPLTELHLLAETPQRGVYEFRVGPKLGLSDELFHFALREFAERAGSGATLGLEQITYDAGSPGRAFKLDENAVADRLTEIEAASDGVFVWTETAGLRQVQLRQPEVTAGDLLARVYSKPRGGGIN